MRPVARLDVVALQVEGYVAKRLRVAVDVQGAYLYMVVAAGPRRLELAEEVLREVRGCCASRQMIRSATTPAKGVSGGGGPAGREGEDATVGGERGARELEQLRADLDGEDALVGQDIGHLTPRAAPVGGSQGQRVACAARRGHCSCCPRASPVYWMGCSNGAAERSATNDDGGLV